MARKPSWGTPNRSERYPPLRQRWGYLQPSAVAGAALALLLLGSYLVGERGALSPGSLTSGHASIEAKCEQCHTIRQGASNVRCQRCHDPASAGRLTAGAHVLSGSGDARKAAAAPDVVCARCHVEHRGLRTSLSAVRDVQCARCHFGKLTAHPEFAVLRASTKEAPGLNFGHQKHIEEVMKKQGLTLSAQSCAACHAKRGRDLEPVSFDRHCLGCHAKQGSLGSVDPVPLSEVVDLEALRAREVPGAGLLKPEEFELNRGKIARHSVGHRDAWILFNLDKLRAESDPEAFAGERARLEARIATLERRLAACMPLASLDRTGLEQRAAALEREKQGAAQRLAALPNAGDANAGAARLREIEAGMRAVGDAGSAEEVSKLAQAAVAPDAAPGPLPAGEFGARRQELLSLLEAVEAADATLKPRTEDLRRRIVALVPGDDTAALLGRVRDQRQAALARVRDEQKLRAQGVSPPREALLEGERRELERALDAARSRLASLASVTSVTPLGPEGRQRRRETAVILAAACTKCHVLSAGALAPVRAARPVLVRARFVHEPHLLQADCGRCHQGIEASKASKDLNFRGISSCRECHKPFQARQDCRECHLFHPKAVP